MWGLGKDPEAHRRLLWSDEDVVLAVVVVVVVVEQGKYKQVSFVTKPGAVSGFSLKASPFELFSGF